MAAIDPGTVGLITVIGVIVTIIGLLCGLFYKYGKIIGRINNLERDVNKLLDETRGLKSLEHNVNNLLAETRDLSIRIESHILSVNALEESQRMGNKK